MTDTTLKLGKYEFKSRLFVGTGKYKTLDLMKDALEASGAEVITVAVRRANIEVVNRENHCSIILTKKNIPFSLIPQDVILQMRLSELHSWPGRWVYQT